MSEGELVIYGAVIGAGSAIIASVVTAFVQLRMASTQQEQRRKERAEDRRFDIYRESLLLLLSLPRLIDEGIREADQETARQEVAKRILAMRAGLSSVGGKKVRDAANRVSEAFSSFIGVAREWGTKNVELPLTQREGIDEIYARAFRQEMDGSIGLLATAMREEMGITE